MRDVLLNLAILLSLCLPAACAAADAPVSFSKRVAPILSESCAGCHRPGKLKGKLDLTTYAGLRAGGKTGPALVAGEPDKSLLVQQVTGPDPQMPDKGDPLSSDQVALIARWIREGAKDDTPAVASAGGAGASLPAHPATYKIAPVVTALAFAPDGQRLVVAGEHEVLIWSSDGKQLLKRLPSRSTRITALLFSPDGKTLVAVGGAPGEFGEVEAWDAADWNSTHRYAISGDTLFGPAFSPDGERLVFGCADKSVRVIALLDGHELQHLEPHTDWALAAAFTLDGKHVASAGRDKSVKLVDLEHPQEFLDLIDPADPILCAVRHPTEDLLVCGGAGGTVRMYRIGDVTKPSESKRDPNRLKEIEHQPGAVRAMTWSADGSMLAIASVGEVHIYKKDGGRLVSLNGFSGAIDTVAFSPDGKRAAAGGFDGQVRVFSLPDGKPADAFAPVPLEH